MIVVDFGTSTNFDCISPDGEYFGGVLAPGIETSMEALFSAGGAARQGGLRLDPPSSDAPEDCWTALQSMIIYGFAGQVDGIVAADPQGARRRGAESSPPAGLAELIAPHSSTIERIGSRGCSRWKGCAWSGS